jgi:1,2-diacylglycerol 3-beta-galactosyltransferase
MLMFPFSACCVHLQEEGNIPYVVDNGVGAFETDPAKIADIMAEWLAPGNKQEFTFMAHRSRALGRPHAVYDIARDLAQLADELGALAKQLVGPAGRRGSKAVLPVGQLASA